MVNDRVDRVRCVGFAAALLVAVGVLGWGGCRRGSHPVERGPRRPPEHQATAIQNELFSIAIQGLRHIEQFEAQEPLRQLVDRLNQWLRAQNPPPDWSLDPLAAPVVKALAQGATQVREAYQTLVPIRERVELKSRARQFASLPQQLEGIGKRVDLKKLDELARAHEETIRQIEASVRQWGDLDRLAEVESKYIEIFAGEVREKAKVTRLQELMSLAKWLDWPNRLRDPNSLGAFVQQLDVFARDRNPKELKALAQQFEEVITRRFGPAGKTKLVVQTVFVAHQLEEISSLKELVAVRLVKRHLSDLSEQLKTSGTRSGRDDVRQLAGQIDAAIQAGDFSKLAELARQLDTLAQPNTLNDLGDLGPRLDQAAKGLAEAGQQMDASAKTLGLENLPDLAQYCRTLSQAASELAAGARRASGATGGATAPASAPKPEADAASPKAPADIQTFSAALLELGSRLEMLVDQLDYFTGMEASELPAIDLTNLQEAVTVRELARWVRGDDPDDLSRAKRLFDWTVRNIQLEADRIERDGKEARHIMQTVWETLFFGRGTATERAWVFVELARQQGIDAALLALDDPSAPPRTRLRPWAVGVFSEGNIYVFDPLWGVPIPGRQGVRLDEYGQIDVQPATLAELGADDRLLRQLDISREQPYPVRSSDLKHLVVLVDASPWWLTRRMRLIESQLTGDDRMVLFVSPTAQAERWKASKWPVEVRPWTVAYETLLQRMRLGPDFSTWNMMMMAPYSVTPPGRAVAASKPVDQRQAPLFWESSPEVAARQTRPRSDSGQEAREPTPLYPLRVGRMLHLKGRLVGSPSATACYQMVRLSDRQLAELGEADSTQYTAALRRAKQHATYWLGLVAFEQRNYASARDYLATRTLEASPQGPWTPGARYNLGRVYEAEKQYAKAIRQYRSNTEAVDYAGNRLRARWLEALAKPADLKELASPEAPRGKDAASETPELPGLPDDVMPAEKPKVPAKKP